MNWIAGWSKRIKSTISGSYIEGDLSNFPVLVHLDSTCSGVFDELGSNSKRISIVDSNQQQCYVEIEDWNESSNTANLWAKIPTLSSGTDSDLYLYYDNLHPDNSTYVGTVGETPAQNVWDSNFVGVWHMNQDPTGDVAECIKDSTSNNNDGTPGGGMTSGDLVDGKVGKALDFDGSDDLINVGSDSELDDINQITCEAIIKVDTYGEGTYGRLFDKYRFAPFLYGPNARFGFFHTFDSNNGEWHTPNNSIDTGTTYGVALTYDKTSIANDPLMYIDGTSQTLIEHYTPAGSANIDASYNLYLGNNSGQTRTFDGILEEVRISNIARSAPWIKATYHSNWNQLINYGNEENIPCHQFSGVVKVENIVSDRKVNLYNQSTGELMDYTTSNSGTGAWLLSDYGDIDNKYFIVCVPESDSRNAEVFANLIGV